MKDIEYDWMDMIGYVYPATTRTALWATRPQTMDAISSSTVLHQSYVAQVKFILVYMTWTLNSWHVQIGCSVCFVISPLALDGLFLSCLPKRSLESAANVRAAKNQLAHLSWRYQYDHATSSKSVSLASCKQAAALRCIMYPEGLTFPLLVVQKQSCKLEQFGTVPERLGWVKMAHVAHVAHVSTCIKMCQCSPRAPASSWGKGLTSAAMICYAISSHMSDASDAMPAWGWHLHQLSTQSKRIDSIGFIATFHSLKSLQYDAFFNCWASTAGLYLENWKVCQDGMFEQCKGLHSPQLWD